eukprot:4007542-Pyramimonas_sp.AAC.1
MEVCSRMLSLQHLALSPKRAAARRAELATQGQRWILWHTRAKRDTDPTSPSHGCGGCLEAPRALSWAP